MNAIELKTFCLESGFDLFGIAKTDDSELKNAAGHYHQWLQKGFGASMTYLNRHQETKSNPEKFLSKAKSVVVVGYTYGDANSPLTSVSQYARGDDYHEILTDKLELIVDKFSSGDDQASCRIFVDWAPVFDRFWAARAGLGWIGKNTCLINRKIGSYFFIGGFFTTDDFAEDSTEDFTKDLTDHCGKCTRCIEACPTAAIKTVGESKKYTVDSNLCISYHTIENRGEVPLNVQAKMKNWIAGCDVCQQVCPWNDPVTHATEYKTTNPAYGASLDQLAKWEQKDFENKLKTTAMRRMKYEGFERNLKIVQR